MNIKKMIASSVSISAIFLITLAIAYPGGIRYYEDIMIIKITEITLSILVVLYILNNMFKD